MIMNKPFMISNKEKMEKIYKKLRPIIEEEYLYEGLLYTYDILSTLTSLTEKYSTNYIQFKQTNNKNKFLIIFYDGRVTYNHLKLIINEIRHPFGWYPSMYYSPTIKKKEKFTTIDDFFEKLNKDNTYILMFNAEYDMEIDQCELLRFDAIYHVSPYQYKEKILKIGLAPKSKNKEVGYSNRLYLSTTIRRINELLKNERFAQNNKKFVIYRIDIKNLLKKRKMRFFDDSDFIKSGLYTYENIPPQFITIEKEIIIE